MEEAKRLLQNVGELEPLPMSANVSAVAGSSSSANNNYSNITVTNSTYQIGDIVHANYKGDGEWYLAEISSVFPDEYYNAVYFDDCSEEIAIPVSRIRPRETKVDNNYHLVEV